MKGESAVEFGGNSRIHIGLAVAELERSKQFYRTLFGVEPVKVRPRYAKFEPVDPSVNLSLNEVRGVKPQQELAVHYGIQVKSSQAVAEAADRFRRAGLETLIEEQSTCCYAVQDKVWVSDPDGNRWEVFVVLDADAETRKDEGSACCAGGPAAHSCC